MEIYPEKGRYRPGEPIELTIVNDGDAERFRVSVFTLDECVCSLTVKKTGMCTRVTLPPVDESFAGLGVVCQTELDEHAACAVDVQKELRVFRYGFLSDFSKDEANETDVLAMAKHHINAVQFYDWSYRHDTLVAPQSEYEDMMGKQNSLDTIKRKIEACHTRGMRAIGYGAVYAASESFAKQHADWRLYAHRNEPLRFIDVFAIMNLESAWQSHLIGQYCDATERVGFDGIHMDAYGFPKTALNADGDIVHLEDDFAPLIKETRNALPDATLVFNNVGNWPVERTMRTPVDAVYIEVWPPYERYGHIKQLILNTKTAQKPVMLAAYPAPFRTDTPERALNAQLVLMSAIAAHGATQLWFGEENAALTQGYYADSMRLTDGQERLLRAYDDFFVRYETLLFDDTLKDVSFTHCGWDNQEYVCDTPYTIDGEGGKLWVIIREDKNRKLIQLINLCGDENSCWNEGRSAPQVQSNVRLHIQIYFPVKKAWMASPDREGGDAQAVPYGIAPDDRADVLSVIVPHVERYSMLYLETKGNA